VGTAQSPSKTGVSALLVRLCPPYKNLDRHSR
jgi:hypothetical protein